jgi:methionyl-tRNA formyltransferase
LYEFAKSYKLDILFSINYLFIIEEDVISLAKYPINFHGSLLPKYRGRTPHVWAIINNEKQTGVTAHIINKGCDTGDIILQETIEIGDEETGNDVLQKYVAVYPIMLQKILHQVKNNTLIKVEQIHDKATYFDKRTPDDGEINWDWQKERIRNWVRAQAYPYPGAFTFYNNNKIIIDKVEYSDSSFENNTLNGTVLKVINDQITVKTPNGAINLVTIRNLDKNYFPVVGSILGSNNK